LRRWRGPVVLVWDRLPGHRGRQVREFAARSRRLHIEYLPPYAPELNPNEFAWSYLKTHLLPQYCPHDLKQLAFEARWQTLRLSGRERLLRSFLDATRLPFRWPP
jgi:transposase